MEINYIERDSGKPKLEKVYGGKFVQWLYGPYSGKFFHSILCRRVVSNLYGMFQSSHFSFLKIAPFIKNFSIDMDQFEPEDFAQPEMPYSTFNSFFVRKFKDGKRDFIKDEDKMPAFCEGRYFGHDRISGEELFPVKGKFLNSKALLYKMKWQEIFEDGPLLVCRLCPTDYHRFHYPLDGEVVDHYRVDGMLHSVNPIALKKFPDIFAKNERQVTIVKTKEFGKIAYVEVGAICVGKIQQTSDLKKSFRGQEKGYFLFGGSTVIVMGEKGKWKPSADIINNTEKGIETFINLGQEVAVISE